MLDLLIEGDHRKCLAAWKDKMPGMPQPVDERAAEIAMHLARTRAAIPKALRLWSHKWLTERDLPSLLPEHMVAEAEKLSVVEKKAVAISVGAMSPKDAPAAKAIRSSLESAVIGMMNSRGNLPASQTIKTHLDSVFKLESKRLLGV